MTQFSNLKAFSQYFLPKNLITVLAGMLAQVKIRRIKNFLIHHFIRLYGVNMQEAMEENPENYADFNAFFIRKLKPEARTIASADIICPVDGCISEIGDIHQGQIFQAKGHHYSVASLLASDADLWEPFVGGRFVTLYLSPKDYHRVHMPMDAKLRKSIYVPGKLFSVQPASARAIPNLFARNKRLVMFFDTSIGPMAMVMVGATIVGKIGTAFQGDIPSSSQIIHTDFIREVAEKTVFKKGDELGYFKLGSTVILLFGNHEAMQWNKNLAAVSPVQLGQDLGSTNA